VEEEKKNGKKENGGFFFSLRGRERWDIGLDQATTASQNPHKTQEMEKKERKKDVVNEGCQ